VLPETKRSEIGSRRLRLSRMRVALAGLLCLTGGSGLGWLDSSANGQRPGEPVFHDDGPIVFNFVPLGSTSEAKSVTISNAGEGTLGIASIKVSVPKDFSVVANECTGMSLAAGQSCALSVVFHPSTVGTRVGSLVVSDSRGTGCDDYIGLAGSGTETPAPTIANAATCAVSETVTAPGQTVTDTTPVYPPATTTPMSSEVDTLQIVSPPRCVVSERHLRLHLRVSKAEPIAFASVYINGHLNLVARGQNLSVVTLELPYGRGPRYRVQVVASTAGGETVGLTRYFGVCRRQSVHRLPVRFESQPATALAA